MHLKTKHVCLVNMQFKAFLNKGAKKEWQLVKVHFALSKQMTNYVFCYGCIDYISKLFVTNRLVFLCKTVSARKDKLNKLLSLNNDNVKYGLVKLSERAVFKDGNLILKHARKIQTVGV